MAAKSLRRTVKVLLFGTGSGASYLLLFVYAGDIMRHTAQGGWYAAIPVAIAFVFSYVHGSFTAHFWDALGIRAKDESGRDR